MEAVASHVLVELWDRRPQTTFAALLGQAFVAVGLATPEHKPEPGEGVQAGVDRALFGATCAVNRLRNAEGAGHGRPWPPSVTEEEARLATQLMGVVAGRLLGALAITKSANTSNDPSSRRRH